MLVVVDTNVWISALLNPRGHPAKVMKAFVEGRFTPVVSQQLLEELVSVLQRPRIWRTIARRLAQIDIQLARNLLLLYQGIALALVHTLYQSGHTISLQGDVDLCRDKRDNMVLETAQRGKAHCLVTRDDDLKRVPELIAHMEGQGIRVLTVQQFLDVLANDGC